MTDQPCPHCGNTGRVQLPDYSVRCECPAALEIAKLEREVWGWSSRRIIPRWQDRRAEYLQAVEREETPIPRKPPQPSTRQLVHSRVWDRTGS